MGLVGSSIRACLCRDCPLFPWCAVIDGVNLSSNGDVVRTDLTVLRALSTTSFGLCSKFNAQAAQKPYSSTGAGLVLRGSNSKWYQEGAIVTARHRNRLSRQLPSQPVSKQRGRVNGPRVLVQRRLSPFQQRGRGELAQGIQMGDSRSDDCRSSDSENRILSPPTKPGLFRIALIQCQPLVKDLHGAEPFSPTCFGESLIRTKLVGVASSKQLPLAPIDEKEIELEKSKEDFDPGQKVYPPGPGKVCVKSSHVLGQVMALASFPLWDHLAFVGLRFPAAESFTPFTE
ncbi:hypothetical protein L1987_88792 [Smallanthus sonchifolius]|nr:hypothetical protein L1987_88792 [Smallanthus sonchifolius]